MHVRLIAFICLWLASPLAAESLGEVRTWMYQIQDLNEDGAVEVLAASPYDMLVIEPGHNFTEYPYDTKEIVQALRQKPDGSKRLLLAYIDIGQAEDYRDYWQDGWQAPDEDGPGQPDFLITIDPDGWSGNYPVAFWDPRWQALWLAGDGIIGDLVEMGFDGIYLDWIEAYDDEAVMAVAEEWGIAADVEMITFIERMRTRAHAQNPDFVIVAQNAHYLIDSAPTRYTQVIDALAVEDTWFHGWGDSDWDDPDGGDQRDRHDDDYSTPARLAQIAKYQRAGLPVFSIDYALEPDNVALAYEQALLNGFIPLVSRVSLSQMTETPPPALKPRP